jgi:anti-sigma factor RsiW
MICQKMVLLTQAELDGELDVAAAAAVTVHRAMCAECQAAYHTIRAVHALLHRESVRYEMSTQARQRLLARLRRTGAFSERAASREPSPRSLPWRGLALGASVSAAIAAAVLLTSPRPSDPVAAVVDAHVRALLPGHLLDVPSTDPHSVMPWFNGRTDFTPPVRDLADQGFPLQGGRRDYVGGHSAAALVYGARQHVIDLFVWPDPDANDSEPVSETRNGYNALHWNERHLSLWAISDVNTQQLGEFVGQWRRAP